MNSKNIGELSEAVCLAAFVRAGEVVLQPFGDNQRYDLVLDRGGSFVRVQVKTGRLRDGAIVASACSSSSHRTNGAKQDYRGQADLFAVYCPDTDEVYVIPVEDVGFHVLTLRVDPTANNQEKNIRWAKDYLYDSR